MTYPVFLEHYLTRLLKEHSHKNFLEAKKHVDCLSKLPCSLNRYPIDHMFHGQDKNSIILLESDVQLTAGLFSPGVDQCDPPVVGTHLLVSLLKKGNQDLSLPL